MHACMCVCVCVCVCVCLWRPRLQVRMPARAKIYAIPYVNASMRAGGEPLETFEHPTRAVYILGSEDNGLPTSVVKACHCHVALPSINYASFNVAVAGSVIMYDRVLKQVWGGRPKREPGASTPSPWRRSRSGQGRGQTEWTKSGGRLDRAGAEGRDEGSVGPRPDAESDANAS